MGRLCADEYPCSEVQDEQEMAQEDLMMAVATEAAKLIAGKESSSVYLGEDMPDGVEDEFTNAFGV